MPYWLAILHACTVVIDVCSLSQGAQSVFKELPHEYVSPDDLKEVMEKGGECVGVLVWVTLGGECVGVLVW